jgi:hypothetical protein
MRGNAKSRRLMLAFGIVDYKSKVKPCFMGLWNLVRRMQIRGGGMQEQG